MIDEFNSLGWLLASVIGLAILQRRLHFEIQAIFLLLTRRIDLSITLFSILFLPGVLIHETSHYLMARLLSVPVNRISLLPQPMSDGRLRLGYVKTSSTDFLRDSLIGVAPLIAGSIFVAYAGLVHLQFMELWRNLSIGSTSSIKSVIEQVLEQPDFWIWFYIIFVISSTMFPSVADRKAWTPILILLCIFIVFVLIAGAGPWLWENLGTSIMRVAWILSMIFLVSAIVHLLLLPPLWLIRLSLSRLIGLKIV